ncbi:hypothetical protein E2C01_087286 [Portunus trituberculatus]|uniref:Uncharacterized protein n=1 Tax=Portunus trituberculatus TaxID=210409 RepID=A0A5B7J671_PORTR|nr:hypothetical protein [Portunus trituberculatus]
MPWQISINSRGCPAAPGVRQPQREKTCNQSHCWKECEQCEVSPSAGIPRPGKGEGGPNWERIGDTTEGC